MRITLTTLAVLVTLTTSAHAELVQSQSLTTPFDVPSLASNALSRDSKTVNATTLALATTPTLATTRDTTSSDNVAVAANANTVVKVTNIDSSSDDNDQRSDNLSVLDRLSSVANDTVRKFKQTGIASWYGHQFNGRKTATGERFDMNAMTAAHRSLPLACFIRVTNKDNGKSVIVKVNDRGPYSGNRILDLSYGAAEKLGIVNKGMGNVTIERVSGPNQ
ncbi:septal ring lytic transglycosylase RlpA family protein [Aquirhabdus parva]|uniref:Endolytic peptidoglycan transglycosylase RlpA n=1 Tax=Aquirhabdus parva TaxID=2283318 RepID=A0A345P717_9GAMM|nr:septal ring lytic transglycosylase RlpA family protein [Aquirhabdus parva]AXI03076.1 septal ring lytic transglycosylase RlpA family protein [Aquirhabdus parva]